MQYIYVFFFSSKFHRLNPICWVLQHRNHREPSERTARKWLYALARVGLIVKPEKTRCAEQIKSTGCFLIISIIPYYPRKENRFPPDVAIVMFPRLWTSLYRISLVSYRDLSQFDAARSTNSHAENSETIIPEMIVDISHYICCIPARWLFQRINISWSI